MAVGLCGSTFALPSGAQVVVPPGSEVPIPPKPPTDTTAIRRDTIQPPFGRSVLPAPADIGPRYSWNRDELFASGTLTLSDLLDRVPGVTNFRSGWLLSPKVPAYNGGPGRVRVFQDDLELDDLDPRNEGVRDLTSIQLWTLESVVIERAGDELRVHLRSWRVDRTTPSTRTDVFTGDEDTNIYRGYYGKRFAGGQGLQLAGQQFNTRLPRLGGGGDALSFMGRAGVARRGWSFDVFANRTHQTRVLQPSLQNRLSIPEFDGTHTVAYARAAIGSAGGGPWFQAIASYMRLVETSPRRTDSEALTRRVVPDTADTTTQRNQYVLQGGFTRGGLRFSAGNRIRAAGGETFHSLNARGEFSTSLAQVALTAEREAFLGFRRGDVIFRFTPLPFLAVAGSAARVTPDSDSADRFSIPASSSARIEAGVRVIRPWVSMGLLTTDTALLGAPTVFDTAYVPVAAGRRTATFAALRGQLYRDIGIDFVATRRGTPGFYEPRYQTRAEVNLVTRWLSRFPGGNFGLKASFAYDHRTAISFPLASGVRMTPASQIMSGLLEIRILSGVLSYQVRNIAGLNHFLVPDFLMPRVINLYGVRWEFWN